MSGQEKDTLTPMTIAALADVVLLKSNIQAQLERANDRQELSADVALSRLVMATLEELFDSRSSDEANLERVAASLERAADILVEVATRIRQG